VSAEDAAKIKAPLLLVNHPEAYPRVLALQVGERRPEVGAARFGLAALGIRAQGAGNENFHKA